MSFMIHELETMHRKLFKDCNEYCMYKDCFSLTENTICFHQKDKSVNAV